MERITLGRWEVSGHAADDGGREGAVTRTRIMIRTSDQRVRVFVSSTLKKRTAERQAVAAAITQLRSASPKVSS
jgi:hypothetical protein